MFRGRLPEKYLEELEQSAPLLAVVHACMGSSASWFLLCAEHFFRMNDSSLDLHFRIPRPEATQSMSLSTGTLHSSIPHLYRGVVGPECPHRSWLRCEPDLSRIRARIWLKSGSDLSQIWARIWLRSGADPDQIWLRSEPDLSQDLAQIWLRSGSYLSQI